MTRGHTVYQEVKEDKRNVYSGEVSREETGGRCGGTYGRWGRAEKEVDLSRLGLTRSYTDT